MPTYPTSYPNSSISSPTSLCTSYISSSASHTSCHLSLVILQFLLFHPYPTFAHNSHTFFLLLLILLTSSPSSPTSNTSPTNLLLSDPLLLSSPSPHQTSSWASSGAPGHVVMVSCLMPFSHGHRRRRAVSFRLSLTQE